MFAVSARASFLVARVHRTVVAFARASTAPKTSDTPITRVTKTCYTPIVAHKNHGHTHRGTATVPLILLAYVVQSGWLVVFVAVLRALSSTGAVTTDVRGRNRALLLRSSSLFWCLACDMKADVLGYQAVPLPMPNSGLDLNFCTMRGCEVPSCVLLHGWSLSTGRIHHELVDVRRLAKFRL